MGVRYRPHRLISGTRFFFFFLISPFVYNNLFFFCSSTFNSTSSSSSSLYILLSHIYFNVEIIIYRQVSSYLHSSFFLHLKPTNFFDFVRLRVTVVKNLGKGRKGQYGGSITMSVLETPFFFLECPRSSSDVG